MRLPWRQEARQIDSLPVSTKALDWKRPRRRMDCGLQHSAWGVAIGRNFESVLM